MNEYCKEEAHLPPPSSYYLVQFASPGSFFLRKTAEK